MAERIVELTGERALRFFRKHGKHPFVTLMVEDDSVCVYTKDMDKFEAMRIMQEVLDQLKETDG